MILKRHKNQNIKNNIKFNPFANLFDKDNNIKMSCEHQINNNRIDFTLQLKSNENTPFFIGIEFIEDRAQNEDNNYNKIQEMRWNRISVSNKNVKHIVFIWESLWNRTDGYKEYFIKKLEYLFDIYNSVDNKEEFGIQFLDKFLDDREISAKLLQAYNNEFEHILSYNELIQIFGITNNLDKLKNKFIKNCDRKYEIENMYNTDNNYDDFILDDEELPHINNLTISNNMSKFYIYKSNNLMINSKGLIILTEVINEDNFNDLIDYNMVKNIYHNVAKAAIHAINKTHELTKDLIYNNEFRSFGLNHREKEPEYDKIL